MLNFKSRTTLYQQALRRWGKELQLMMVIEEMSELTKEIVKHFRGKGTRDALVDEIADVKIMLEQLEDIFSCTNEVDTAMQVKILKLQMYLDE